MLLVVGYHRDSCNLTHRELFCLWQTKSVWCRVVREFVDSSQNSRKHDLALMAWLVASPSDKPSKLVISLFLVVGKFSCNQLQGKRIIKWRLQRWRLYVIATVSDFCWLRASPHMSGCGMSDSKVIGRIRSQGTSRIFSIVCISHITN